MSREPSWDRVIIIHMCKTWGVNSQEDDNYWDDKWKDKKDVDVHRDEGQER